MNITAVVVTWNGLEDFRRCIAALRNQTRRIDRIVVVNNASTDGTKEWLDSQTGLEVIHQRKNLGNGGGLKIGYERALELGADLVYSLDDDAVAKENAVENILDAIVTVAGGGHYLSPSVSGCLVHRRNRAEALATQKPGLDDLTRAERRILKHVSEKKTSREIAAELFISPRTVEVHRARVMQKLGLHNRTELIHFAIRRGIIPEK